MTVYQKRNFDWMNTGQVVTARDRPVKWRKLTGVTPLTAITAVFLSYIGRFAGSRDEKSPEGRSGISLRPYTSIASD